MLVITAFPAFVSANSNPLWIWGSENAHKDAVDGECEFQRSIQLEAKPKSVTIELNADDQYTLRINGRFVGSSNDVRRTRRFDVTPLFKMGENQIYVRCRNNGGPAGFRCQIDIDLPSKPNLRVVTDSSWEAKLQPAGTWDPSIRARTPWHKPHILTTDVTSPWANNLQPASETERIRTQQKSNGPLELRDGDRVVWLGNTFVERAQRHGLVEYALTRNYPERHIIFRNLGWSGDTVFGEARARFGTVDDGFHHLETQVHLVEPTLIFVCYGANAAFKGTHGLPEFVSGYGRLLDVLETTGARITVVAPIPHENLPAPMPDQSTYNQHLRQYRKAIRLLAEQRELGFIDLADRIESRSEGPKYLTDNGIHLTKSGYRVIAQSFEHEIRSPSRSATVDVHVSPAKSTATDAKVTGLKVNRESVEFHAQLKRLPIPDEEESTVAFVLKIRGLSPGVYQVKTGGNVLLEADHNELQKGVSVATGPDVAQAMSLLKTINRKNELFFHRWRPQNETYLFLFRKHEQGNNAIEIPRFDPLVEAQEKLIAELRLPKKHVYSVSQQ